MDPWYKIILKLNILISNSYLVIFKRQLQLCIRFFIIKSVLLTLMLLAWCCVFTKDNFTKFHVLFLFSKLGNARWCHEVNSSSTETFLAVIVRRAPNVLQAAQWRNISYMLETGLLRFDRNFSRAKKWIRIILFFFTIKNLNYK